MKSDSVQVLQLKSKEDFDYTGRALTQFALHMAVASNWFSVTDCFGEFSWPTAHGRIIITHSDTKPNDIKYKQADGDQMRLAFIIGRTRGSVG